MDSTNLICIVAAVIGVAMVVKPDVFRKMWRTADPKLADRTTRIVGVLVAVVCALGAVYGV